MVVPRRVVAGVDRPVVVVAAHLVVLVLVRVVVGLGGATIVAVVVVRPRDLPVRRRRPAPPACGLTPDVVVTGAVRPVVPGECPGRLSEVLLGELWPFVVVVCALVVVVWKGLFGRSRVVDLAGDFVPWLVFGVGTFTGAPGVPAAGAVVVGIATEVVVSPRPWWRRPLVRTAVVLCPVVVFWAVVVFWTVVDVVGRRDFSCGPLWSRRRVVEV